MKVSGKNHYGAKQNNNLLCPIDSQRENSKYEIKMQRNDKTKTKIKN